MRDTRGTRARATSRPAPSIGFGRTRIVEPAHRVAVQLRLVDRLARAGVAQLGRPVGGAHEQRYPRVRGLDHRGMEVRGRGSRGAAHDRGPAAGEPDAERAERGRALVEDDLDADPVVAREREGERRRTRAGRDDGVGAARPRPLVDECSGERRRRVACVRLIAPPEWSRCRSCSCRASRRPRRRGARSCAARRASKTRSCSAICRSRRPSRQRRMPIGELGGAGMYVGYSMGGRLCLRLALDRPDLVRALVLVSASPGSAHRRRTRRARRGRRGAGPRHRARRRRRVPHALARAADVRVDPARPLRRRRPATALRPSTSRRRLRVLGTGAMEPLWDRLRGAGRCRCSLVTGTRRREVRRASASEMRAAIGANAGARATRRRPRAAARAAGRAPRPRGRVRARGTASPTPARPRAARRSTSWKRTVPISAATSDGASWLLRTSWIGRTASGAASSARSAGGASTPHAIDGDERADHAQRRTASRARAAPMRTASVRLPVDAIGVDVADVVGEQDRARREADRERAEPRGRRHRLVLHVRAADRRDEAEEDEHHHFAEPDVAVRLRAAGVGRGGDDREQRRRASSHGFTTSESTAPTTAATPNAMNAALRTAAGDASPLATSRTGPRRFASVPRTPSE